MPVQEFNAGLLQFLQKSPTPFHAVKNIATALREAGFNLLTEDSSWSIRSGGKYFLTRNDSSIIAFIYGEADPVETGLRIVGAHTDSPTLMIKPKPEICDDYFQLGVEVYGGALLNPWFDRDLSIAGRVVYRDKTTSQLAKALVNFDRAIAVIPSLAIHLDREANNNRKVNPQTDIPPILFRRSKNKQDSFRDMLTAQLFSERSDINNAEILDYELCLYDTQPPSLVGMDAEFIASARLDNLLSCYVGLQALLRAEGRQSAMLICTDHEEVGSASACGAQGPMLATTLERMVPQSESRARMIAQSLLISADNAHGVHPNYRDRHDKNHGPVLNGGPVVKTNVNQRYATNAISSSLFREWSAQENIQLQYFVARSDMACGSTIGPITATEIGVTTLDVGVPTFAMHSIRELAGSQDAYDLYRIMVACFNHNGALHL